MLGLRTNFAIQLFGGVINTVIMIALTPLLINTIGLERYGVILIILSLTIYVGLAEFGIGMAVSQKISGLKIENERRIALGVGLAISLVFGVSGGIVFAAASLPGAADMIGLNPLVANELKKSWMSLFLL